MDASSLDHLRQEIDAIDGELHGLIQRRAALVDDIAGAKPAGGLALRPGREAVVLRRRLDAHLADKTSRFPAAALFRMWREMMCALTLMQTPVLRIAICRPADQPGYWDLARDHFGCQIPFISSDTPTQVLAAVRSNPTTLGIVPAPIEADATPWWPLLAGTDATMPNVVARLPFLPQPNARARGISALVLARIEPEASGDDRSLVSIDVSTSVSRDRLFAAIAKAGLPMATSALDQLVGGSHHYLVEIPGVIADGDPRLRQLETALAIDGVRVAAIGAYATPYTPPAPIRP